MTTYLYRLDVTYPPGSLELGWEPAGWEPDTIRYPGAGRDEEDDRFRWPRNRRFLSRTGAKHLADLFRKYGAEVEIVRSKPVEWPGGES